MAALDAVVRYLDSELRTKELPDYDSALNGLQLGNSGTITRIASAVDFSGEVVARAIEVGANLLLVHHGMFWRGHQRLTGHAYQRLHRAIMGDLAVYSSHIPLDMHPRLGNNVLLARALGLEPNGAFGTFRDVRIGVSGMSDLATDDVVARAKTFAAQFDTTAVASRYARGRRTRRWAIVTGAGASPAFLAEAVEQRVDTLIVGEGTHHSAVDAVEQGLVVVYAGHYATETLGVRALAEELAERFEASCTFIAAPTGL